MTSENRTDYPEIFGRTPFDTLEGMKKYFEALTSPKRGVWARIKQEWKKDLIDVALPKTDGEILIDPSIELTDSLLNKGFDVPILNNNTLVLIIKRLHDEGRLTPEIMEKSKLTYNTLNHYYLKVSKSIDTFNQLMDDENIIDHFIKTRDVRFFSPDTKWSSSIKITKEHIIAIILGFDFVRGTINPRIKDRVTEDDFVWIYFEAEKYGKVDRDLIRKYMMTCVEDGIINISLPIITALNDFGDTSNYESFKDMLDMFVF